MSHKSEITLTLSIDRKTTPFLTEEQMLTWIHNCLNCNTEHAEVALRKVDSVEKPTIVVDMNGGVINDVKANHPARVIFLDEDTEGGDEENIFDINGSSVYVSDYEADVRTSFVDDTVAQFDEQREEEGSDSPSR